MTFNPTRRRNGAHMVTVRTAHHVTRSVVVETIAVDLWDESDGADVSRTAVEAAVRTAYGRAGDDWDMDVGDILADSDDRDAAVEWAEEQITRLYPRWRP